MFKYCSAIFILYATIAINTTVVPAKTIFEKSAFIYRCSVFINKAITLLVKHEVDMALLKALNSHVYTIALYDIWVYE